MRTLAGNILGAVSGLGATLKASSAADALGSTGLGKAAGDLRDAYEHLELLT